jgi:hypothetical protein
MTHGGPIVIPGWIQYDLKVSPRCPQGVPKVSPRCPQGVPKVSQDVLSCTKCPKYFKLLSVSLYGFVWVIELRKQLKIGVNIPSLVFHMALMHIYWLKFSI